MKYLKSTLISSANIDLEYNQLAFEDRFKDSWIPWIPVKTINYFQISTQLFSIAKDFVFCQCQEDRAEGSDHDSRTGLISLAARASWEAWRAALVPSALAAGCVGRESPAWHRALQPWGVIHAAAPAWFTLQSLGKMLSPVIITEFGEP